MFSELDYKVNAAVEDFIKNDCKKGDASKTGLDNRALGLFWFNFDCIVIPACNRRTLDYYGGFEYIDSDYVKQYGDYVVYSAEAERVQEVLDAVFDSFEECADA